MIINLCDDKCGNMLVCLKDCKRNNDTERFRLNPSVYIIADRFYFLSSSYEGIVQLIQQRISFNIEF